MRGQSILSGNEPFEFLEYPELLEAIEFFWTNHVLVLEESKLKELSRTNPPSVFVLPGCKLKLIDEGVDSLFGVCKVEYLKSNESIAQKLWNMSTEEIYGLFQIIEFGNGYGVISYLKPNLN